MSHLNQRHNSLGRIRMDLMYHHIISVQDHHSQIQMLSHLYTNLHKAHFLHQPSIIKNSKFCLHKTDKDDLLDK